MSKEKPREDPWEWWEPAIRASNRSADANWLVMVYLAGDNNLTEEMVLALQALQAAGAPQDDKIVAQLDPSGMGLPTQRYDFSNPLKSNGHRKVSLSDYLVPDYPVDETNTGNPNALSGFIKWAHDYRPNSAEASYGTGRKHFLILSGHGSGTTEDFLLRDENSMDALSIDELAIAVEDATVAIRKKIDILGMDACFMSMFEVCFQIREYVDIVIGAEGPEPGFGWPYLRILARARAWRNDTSNPNHYSMDPESLAKMIVTEYVENYSDYDRSAGRSVDLAAIRLGGMTELGAAVNSLAAQLKAHKSPDKVTLSHWKAQTYKFDQYVDLKDFCDKTEEYFEAAAIRAREAVVDLLSGGKSPGSGAIIRSGCSGFAYQHSHGLSIYFPWAHVSPDYGLLEFCRAPGGWFAFLDDQVDATQREPRFDEGLKEVSAVLSGVAKALPRIQMKSIERSLETAFAEDAALRPSFEKVKDRLLAGQDAKVQQAERRLKRKDVPLEDALGELHFRRAGLGLRKSRYTGEGSRYTGEGSRYTGEGSKYTGEGSRSPADREKSVKNLPPVIGKAYWPV